MAKKVHKKRVILFPSSREEDWRSFLIRAIQDLYPGSIDLDCNDWHLKCRDIKEIIMILKRANLKIDILKANVRETIVSSTSLGQKSFLNIPKRKEDKSALTFAISGEPELEKVLFHEGTLRSGEHLEAEGDVLVLGDVNPGARISAGGDVMIWGRLLGVAHAGKSGDNQSKIIALELRPLQLRIADQIARGPKEKPQSGFTEEAYIESGEIIIKPARIRTIKS